jgi:hypothetical protein
MHQPALAVGRVKKVGTSHDMSEMRLRIINRSGQLVSDESVTASHDEICDSGRWGNRLHALKSVCEAPELLAIKPYSQAVWLVIGNILLLATLAAGALVAEGRARAAAPK